MDDHDEQDKRRFMTPPKEWGGDDEDGADWLMASEDNSASPQPSARPPIDDVGWLTSGSEGTKLEEHAETNSSSGGDWFTDGEITASPEKTTPLQAEGTASPPITDTQSSEAPEAETHSAADIFDAGTSSEFSSMDLLTDHHIVGTSTTGKLPLWPTIAGIAAVVLLLVGGWGAISERSSLQNRIVELEDQQGTPQSQGNLDAGDEAVLEAKNQALTLQLTTLKGDYSAANNTIQALQVELDNAEKLAAQATQVAAIRKSDSAPRQQMATRTERKPTKTGPTSNTSTSIATTTPRTSANQSEGLWFANVAAYSRRATAEKWAQKLQNEGYNAVTQSVDIDGRTLYRVRAVGFSTKNDAKATAAELESTYNLGALWIGKTSVPPARNARSQPQTKPALDKAMPTTTTPKSTDATTVDASGQGMGGWFIYVDTYAQGMDADNKAQQIEEAGYAAKVAVEYRSGELLYRVQIVGINSRERGEEIIQTLAAGGDMPNLQLRQY
ncbi:SPOR domain-containing protein [Luminiphilus sp. nBUS_16]|uniref:SPOR domain-containing protein n=1 Tax=Luminiphilus sp. nBUS_16 TaxID=3395315 RepID=UPI003EBBFEA0